jgi:tetratricopeptide (TPR) repeat protein
VIRLIALSALLLLAACGSRTEEANRLGRSDDPDDLREAGRIYATEIDRMVNLYRENVRVRQKLGRELMRKELFGDALEHLRFAARSMPTDASARLDLAICLSNVARGGAAAGGQAGGATFDEAEAEYQAVLSLDPGSVEARYGLAMVAWKGRNDLMKAEEHARAAVRGREDYGAGHALLARILSERANLTGAAEHYRLAIALDRPGSRTWRELVQSYASVLKALGLHAEADKLLATIGG